MRDLGADDVQAHLEALRMVGDPYSDEMIASASADLAAQADPEAAHDGLLARYPKAVIGDFDDDPARVSEMDALVAYLQMLGTLVDFADIDPADLKQ